MRTAAAVVILIVLATAAFGQNVKRIDQYNTRFATNPGDLFLIEDNTFQTYWNQTRSNLNAQFVQQIPNAWSGPTNTVDLDVATHNNGDLYYVTYTPLEVTGFANKSATGVQTVTLTVYNAAATNVTLIIPAACMSRDTLRSYTITNAQDFIISFRYHPGLNHTNSVSCPNG